MNVSNGKMLLAKINEDSERVMKCMCGTIILVHTRICRKCRIANSIDDIDMWQGQRAAFWLARKWDKKEMNDVCI